MSIKLMMEIERAHRRLDDHDILFAGASSFDAMQGALARIEKLEGELKAMKARMGKREPAEI